MSIEVTIINKTQQLIYRVWAKSSDKLVAKDIPALSNKYYSILRKLPAEYCFFTYYLKVFTAKP